MSNLPTVCLWVGGKIEQRHARNAQDFDDLCALIRETDSEDARRVCYGCLEFLNPGDVVLSLPVRENKDSAIAHVACIEALIDYARKPIRDQWAAIRASYGDQHGRKQDLGPVAG